MIDLLIVISYFILILVLAIRGGSNRNHTIDSYFLSSRNLRWPSIALSTIATNINGYQFLGMMGSAYLYGIAQASLEINAIQGILLAAFIFVPMFLRDKVITITQFIAKRLGKKIALAYTLANVLIFSTVTLGAALFWGAYAIEVVFSEYLDVISEVRLYRVAFLIIGLGLFAASYTYLGGLSAVVKTDILQFAILLIGGCVILYIALDELGGLSQLRIQTPQLMHLHLPADHPVLPWTHMFGLFFLNINYWCANQTILQRSLAARSLKDAQVGLLVGGLTKYIMALVIVVPGVALVGILGANGLTEPDLAFPYIVENFLPAGLKGVILCALIASLMSTLDSTFNSLATLWSIDIYSEYLNPEATQSEVIQAGRQTIITTFITGTLVGIFLLYLKFENPASAFTHTLNEIRYFVNTGIVVLICSAGFLVSPSRRWTLLAFFITVPLHLLILNTFPDLNYFVRAGWVISISLVVVGLATSARGLDFTKQLFFSENRLVTAFGWGLLVSLIFCHVILH